MAEGVVKTTEGRPLGEGSLQKTAACDIRRLLQGECWRSTLKIKDANRLYGIYQSLSGRASTSS